MSGYRTNSEFNLGRHIAPSRAQSCDLSDDLLCDAACEFHAKTFFMKRAATASPHEFEEHQQTRLPAITKRLLGIRSVETREPIRVTVLHARRVEEVLVPPAAICDWPNMRPS